MQLIRVFVSSTWIDLIPEREAVERVLQRLRETKFLGMEYFGSREDAARTASLEEVSRANLYIGVFGHRYGSGITEAEYRRARDLGLPCLIYFKDEPPATGTIDTWSGDVQLAELKRELRGGHVVSTFGGASDLAVKLIADLHDWLFDRYVVQGVAAVGDQYAPNIRNFIAEYMGSADRPVPFGGREADLDALNIWLEDDTAPQRLLLAAPAGRGKSALLVHWSRTTARREDTLVIFFPVSIRFNTNLAAVVFPTLAARLALLHNDILRVPASSSLENWRSVMGNYLGRPLPQERRLVLILDGVDEAADWEAAPDLFPYALATGTKLVLSTRFLAGDVDGTNWLRRLGWDEPGRARLMALDLLSARGVAEVLHGLDPASAGLSIGVDLGSELYRLTEGDPLLVRLYVSALAPQPASGNRLQLEELRSIKPGLDGFFQRWWDDQRRLWGNQTPLKEPFVQSLLNILACALGPLSQADLLRLAPQSSGLGVWTLEDALRPLNRFVVGDGAAQGYSFSHPRLAGYFYERLVRAGQAKAQESAFIEWCESTVKALVSGESGADVVSPYVVQYFRPHLERVGAAVEAYRPLITQEWLESWAKLDKGSFTGFLSDVRATLSAAQKANLSSVAREESVSSLDLELRCALCISSVSSLAEDIPAAFLLELVGRGVWIPTQGLAYASNIGDPAQRVRTLVELADVVPESHREQFRAAAVSATQGIVELAERDEMLADVARHLPEPLVALRHMHDQMQRLEAIAALAADKRYIWRHRDLLIGAARIALTVDDLQLRLRLCSSIAPLLPAPEREEVLACALEAARQASPIASRVTHIVTLIPELPGSLLDSALDVLCALRDPGKRVAWLLEAARLIGPAKNAPAIARVRAEAVGLATVGERVQSLLKLAHFAPEEQREAIAREALASVERLPEEHAKADELGAATLFLDQDLAPVALPIAQSIGDPATRVRALLPLIRVLTGKAAHTALQMTFDAVLALDRARRIRIFGTIALYLEDPARTQAFDAALEEIRRIPLKEERSALLLNLIKNLPHSMLARASAIADELPQPEVRSRVQLELIRYLEEPAPLEILNSAVATALALGDTEARMRVLMDLSESFPHPEAREVALSAVLAEIRTFSGDSRAAMYLVALAPRLPGVFAEEARALLRDLRNDWVQFEVLRRLAINPAVRDKLGDLLPMAIAALAAINPDSHRARAALDLLPSLPAGLRLNLLQLVDKFADPLYSVRTLLGFARAGFAGEHDEAFIIACELARRATPGPTRNTILSDLIPALPELMLESISGMVFAVEPGRDRIRLLLDLAQRSSALLSSSRDRLRGALAEIAASADGAGALQLDLLIALAPQLDASQQANLIQTIRQLENPIQRVTLFLRLAQSLPADRARKEAPAAAEPGKIHKEARSSKLENEARKEALAAAVTDACSIADPERRAEMIVKLLPSLDYAQREEALVGAFEKSEALSHSAWLTLADALAAGDVPPSKAVEAAIEHALSMPAYHQPMWLDSLATRLPLIWGAKVVLAAANIEFSEQRASALAILLMHPNAVPLSEAVLKNVRAMTDETQRARTVNRLAAHLPSDTLPAVLQIVCSLAQPTARSRALQELLPELSPPLHSNALLEAFRSMRGATVEADVLLEFLSRVESSSGEQVLREALVTVTAISDKRLRSECLGLLVPHLTLELLGEGLRMLQKVRDEPERSQALLAFGRRMGDRAQRKAAVDAALVAARAIIWPERRSVALANLAPLIAEGERDVVFREAIAAARTTNSDIARAAAIRGIAMQAEAASDAVVHAVLAAVAAFGNEAALLALAPHLPDSCLGRALALAGKREDLLCALTIPLIANVDLQSQHVFRGEIPAGALREFFVLATASGLQIEAAWDLALGQSKVRDWTVDLMAAPSLDESRRTKLLAQALEYLRWLDEDEQVFRLQEIVQYLPESLFTNALARVAELRRDARRYRVLQWVALFIPGNLLDDAIRILAAGKEDSGRASAAKNLVPLVADIPIEHAAAVVHTIDDARERALALGRLAGRAAGAEGDGLMQDAVRVAGQIVDQTARARTLLTLTSCASERCQVIVCESILAVSSEEVLAEAIAAYSASLTARQYGAVLARIAGFEFDRNRVVALWPLLRCAPPPVLADAIAVMRHIRSQFYRSQLLATLGPQLAGPAGAGVLKLIAELSNPVARAQAIARLAGHLPEDVRSSVLEDGLACVARVHDDAQRSMLLGLMTPHLAGSLFESAWRCAEGIKDELTRADALRKLLPGFGRSCIEAAAGTLRALSFEHDRAVLLGELSEYAPPQGRNALMDEAISTARSIPASRLRAEALLDLSLRMSAPENAGLAATLNAMIDVGRDSYSATVISQLAPLLPAPLLVEAWNHIRAMKRDQDRVRALMGLVPWLPATLFAEALRIAGAIRSETLRRDLLCGLAPHVPEALLPDAFAAAGQTRTETYRVDILLELAPRLPSGLLGKAFSAVLDVRKPMDRLRGLSVMAEGLPPNLLKRALDAADHFPADGYRCRLIEAIAPYLPAELRRRASAKACTLGAPLLRDRALAALGDLAQDTRAAQLPVASIRDVLGTEILKPPAQHLALEERTIPAPRYAGSALGPIAAIAIERDRLQALKEVIPTLPESMLGAALQCALKMGAETARASAIACLAPRLPEESIEPALHAALSIEAAEPRHDLLGSLVARLLELPVPKLYRVWQSTLEATCRQHRSDFLSAIEPFAPVMDRLSGGNALHGSAESIAAVGQWW